MNNDVKTGKEVIEEFFAEILDIKGIDQKTVAMLIDLYKDDKLTDSNIQNALEELKQEALDEN